MRTISRTARRRRTRAAVILLSGAVAAGAGIVAPTSGAAAASGGPAHAAAPRCNFVPQDTRPELGESDEGEAVAQVQCLITTRSAYPKTFDVSGIYGPETTTAVLWVQKCNKVNETGYTDPATWKVLYRAKKGCGKSATKPTSKPTTKPPAKPTTKPTKPSTPTKPVKPTKPTKPVKATKPAKPATKPSKPTKATKAGSVYAAPFEIGGHASWHQRPM